jgi:hypothetical protein
VIREGRTRHGALCLTVAACLALGPALARAQFETAAPSLTRGLETSIRSAAMAGAGAAVFWGEPDVWANPATLSGLRGVSWVQGHTNLNPSIGNDIVFDTQQLFLGGAGIGVSLMGQPFTGIGKARFDSGPITFSDPFGSTTFSVFEKTESFGLGISPLRALDAARASQGAAHSRLIDVGEIAVGYQTERTTAGVGFDSTTASFDVGESYDWGVNGRLALARLWWPKAPLRLDVAAAYAELNRMRVTTGASPPPQFRRTGVALHGSPRPPAERPSPPGSLPWWRPADVPEFSATIAYDHDQSRDEFSGTLSSIDHVGLEAEAFRLLALRVGYLSDPNHDIHGVAYGGGVTLPIGPWGSAGYQLAIEPLAEGLKPRYRQGWSLWLDPARMWNDAMRR